MPSTMKGAVVSTLVLASAASAQRTPGTVSPPIFEHRTQSVLLATSTPEYMPQSPAPALKVPVLDGGVWEWEPAGVVSQPVIFDVQKPDWGFSNALWYSNSSIDALLLNSPDNFKFTFISDESSNKAARKATGRLKNIMTDRAAALGASAKLDQMVFSSSSLSSLSSSQPWISTLLCEWPTFLDQMHATVTNSAGDVSSSSIPILNSFYDWLGWAFWPSNYLGNQSLPIVSVSSACGPAVAQNLNGSIALVFDTGECDAYTMVKRVAVANATAVVVVSPTDVPQSMNCVGDECDDQSFGLPAISVSSSSGELLKKWTDDSSVTVSFTTEEQCGTSFGADSNGNLVQTWGGSGLGNPSDTTYGNPGDTAAKQYPSMAFLTYAAQNLNYLADVDVKNSRDATVVSVFNKTTMRPAVGNCYNAEPWGCGPSAVVKVPPPSGGKHTRPYSNAVIDYYLQCNTSADVSCPQWDHVIQLKACCSATRLSESGATCNAQEGFELGRWITSFGRGNGHWRTDVTPWLPLLRPNARTNGNSHCNLTLYTVPWAGNQGQIPWIAVLNLRFENSTGEEAVTTVPTSVLTPWQNVTTNEGDGVYTLFKWIAFNQSYETYFPDFEFSAPAEPYKQAQLVTVLSGHGNDNHGCGEFCSTTHHFTLTRGDSEVQDVALSFENVKNNSGPDNAATGCAESSELAIGTTPNEYGTWLYGRDGWCDGRGVYPWSVDITEQLSKLSTDSFETGSSGDATFSLSYKGLWNNTIPDPSSLQQGSPVMMMQTYIVFSR